MSVDTSANCALVQGELYAGYSQDTMALGRVASGGIVSAILIALLRHGMVDGVVVSRIEAKEGHIQPVTEIVSTPEDVYRFAGSSYIDTPVLDVVNVLEAQSGRYAVVALPCQVRTLQNWLKRKPELRDRIYAIISLFCRGTVRPEFYDDYLNRVGVSPEGVDTIKVSRSYVRGTVTVLNKDSSAHEIPFMRLNSYRQAGIHAKALCGWCYEHTGNQADISVGDIFMARFNQRDRKHSAFIGWTSRGVEILGELCSRDAITAEFVGWETYHQQFAKTEQMSNTLASRYTAARLVGEKRPRQLQEHQAGRFNVAHCLAWMLFFFNGKLSRSAAGRKFLYALPSPVVTAMALFIKALSRL